jgi:nicotinate-nucleotide pyrophosphorylase (carboxylating)
VSKSSTVKFGPAERDAAARLIELALAEDLGDRGDITTQLLIPPTASGTVNVVARQPGRLSGLPIMSMVFAKIDPRVTITERTHDGATVFPGERVATLAGPTASLLTGERTALNFITHLSGIATLTQRFVDAAADGKAVVLDTRKTLPGWRALQKYAVRCGGGTNHRMGYDGVLIKDNHLASWLGLDDQTPVNGSNPRTSLGDSAARANAAPGCRSNRVVRWAIDGRPGRQPDIVLLDNCPGPDARSSRSAISIAEDAVGSFRRREPRHDRRDISDGRGPDQHRRSDALRAGARPGVRLGNLSMTGNPRSAPKSEQDQASSSMDS